MLDVDIDIVEPQRAYRTAMASHFCTLDVLKLLVSLRCLGFAYILACAAMIPFW